MANQRISLKTVEGLGTGDVFMDLDVESEGVQKTITNRQAIRQSVHNILSFNPGERVLYPEFGNTLKDFLFEGIGGGMSSGIDKSVRRMLEDEPRIKVESVSVTPTVDDHMVSVSVSYSIPDLGVTDSVSLTVVGNVA